MVIKIIYRVLGLLAFIILLVLYLFEFSIVYNFLDIFIKLIFAFTVFVEIYQSAKLGKYRIVLSGIWLFLVLGLFILEQLLLAFSVGKTRVISIWRCGSYQVVYKSRLDWAGSCYYRYDLSRVALNGLLRKKITTFYPNGEQKESCIINFPKKEFALNKCTNTLRLYSENLECD